MDNDLIMKQLKALSDPTKNKICEMLREKSLCACELLVNLNITQPTLSHHMKMLAELFLVTVRRQGTWNHYSLNTAVFASISEYWHHFADARPMQGPIHCENKK